MNIANVLEKCPIKTQKKVYLSDKIDRKSLILNRIDQSSSPLRIYGVLGKKNMDDYTYPLNINSRRNRFRNFCIVGFYNSGHLVFTGPTNITDKILIISYSRFNMDTWAGNNFRDDMISIKDSPNSQPHIETAFRVTLEPYINKGYVKALINGESIPIDHRLESKYLSLSSC